MQRAFVFPGQGSQVVGMGQALAEAFPAAREVFEEVDEALGQHLSRIMFEGPEETLTLTENAQPAIMAVGLAAVRVLEAEAVLSLPERARFVAGHSLGEYSALTAAGSLSLADCARLLKRRGQAMQAAVAPGAGAMAAILGPSLEEVAAIAAEAAGEEVCAPSNDNAPGQVVVSGHAAAVERAVELARERGARKAVMLQVSAPFHCALMQPAADVMAEALDSVTVNGPAVPLIANASAQVVATPEGIRRSLVEQVTALVRWRESVEAMVAAEVEELVEVGAGNVLRGLAKRIDRSLGARGLGTPEEIEAFAKAL